MPAPTRRSVLAAGAAIASGAASLAGCAAPPFAGEADEPQPTRLGSVGIRNHDDDPHTVDVVVERNGSVVLRTTREVAGRDGDALGSAVVAAGRFVDDPGRYVVTARLDDESTGERLNISELGGDCYVVHVRIEEDGDLSLWHARDAYECEDRGNRSNDGG